MITILPETTKNPITLIGKRAGVCWGADVTDDEKNYKRGLECIQNDHGRALEYVNVEMIIDGYSARVIREWYTHIGGAPTRLQASTRYIDYKDFEYVTPPKIRLNEEAKKIFNDTMKIITENAHKLEEMGVAREDSAMLLPLGMTTKIVDRRNLRNLIDMSRQRMCTRAYWEYRVLFDEICKALYGISDEWRYIVNSQFRPKCCHIGYCPEKYGCGKMPRKGEKIDD